MTSFLLYIIIIIHFVSLFIPDMLCNFTALGDVTNSTMNITYTAEYPDWLVAGTAVEYNCTWPMKLVAGNKTRTCTHSLDWDGEAPVCAGMNVLSLDQFIGKFNSIESSVKFFASIVLTLSRVFRVCSGETLSELSSYQCRRLF